jgi:hypothetical protein
MQKDPSVFRIGARDCLDNTKKLHPYLLAAFLIKSNKNDVSAPKNRPAEFLFTRKNEQVCIANFLFAFSFSHPDYTVGSGFAPDQP